MASRLHDCGSEEYGNSQSKGGKDRRANSDCLLKAHVTTDHCFRKERQQANWPIMLKRREAKSGKGTFISPTANAPHKDQ